jgi:flagellar hook-associated protein 1
MRSTFMGLEASKRGLFTQQSALYTTGHNISNANTEGYTRQRVNMEATLGYPGAGLNAPKTAGNIGTGVQAHSIQRMRDEFVDRQYRQETNKLGYWESRTNAISKMEDIMSEPSEFGLNQAFNDFWKSMQDVGTRPKEAAARQVAVSKAQALVDSFNYIHTQITQVKQNLGNEIDVAVSDINSILKQIAAINNEIQAVEPNGYMPNDLYDARDVLVDQLNEYMPVSIERVPSGGNALAIAEGSYTIKFNGVELVNGRQYSELTAFSGDLTQAGTVDQDRQVAEYDADGKVSYVTVTDTYQQYSGFTKVTGDVGSQPFSGLFISKVGYPPDPTVGQVTTSTDAELTIPAADTDQFTKSEFEISKGKLLSLIDTYGYTKTDAGVTTTEGYYPDMLKQLDNLAKQLADKFNAMHATKFTLSDGTPGSSVAGDVFFTGDSASTIKVNADIVADPKKLAASTNENEEGNGQGALDLANLQFTGIDTLDGATFQSFYTGLIGKLGVDGQESERLRYNTETIRLQVENNRASMNSVSLDEEMTNMITFQQAYNANARMITVVDECLDKIINGMGRVGL